MADFSVFYRLKTLFVILKTIAFKLELIIAKICSLLILKIYIYWLNLLFKNLVN